MRRCRLRVYLYIIICVMLLKNTYTFQAAANTSPTSIDITNAAIGNITPPFENEENILSTQSYTADNYNLNMYNIIILISVSLIFLLVLHIQQLRLKKADIEKSLHQEKLKMSFMAHLFDESKTPISIIIGLTSGMIEKWKGNSQPYNITDLQIISGQAEKLLVMMNSLLSETINNKGNKENTTESTTNEIISTHIACLFESYTEFDKCKDDQFPEIEFINKLKIKLDMIEDELEEKREELLNSEAETAHQNNNVIISENGESDLDSTTIMPLLLTNNKPSVLLIESNKEMLHFLSSELQDHYQIYTDQDASNVDEIKPDIILANTVLPLKSGYDICKTMKLLDENTFTPFILFSTNNSSEARIKAYKCKADAYLSKPFRAEELLAVMEKLLDVQKKLHYKYANSGASLDKDPLKTNQKNETSIAFINHLSNIIHQEMENSDSLVEVLADKICLSTSQLNRKIKASTGLTTSAFILKVRLKKAAQLLNTSHLPIGEIALNCGFNDFAYFSRSFKKEFGMTPTSFQRLPSSFN